VHQTLLRDFPDQNQEPGRIVQKYVDDIALGAIRASCGYAARYDDAVALVEAAKAFLASLQ
jgi:hypothetical protein